MAPERDEIVKHLDDGFAVAWDTTRLDKRRTKQVAKVVQARAAELGEIIGTGTLASGPGVAAIGPNARRSRPRGRMGAAK